MARTLNSVVAVAVLACASLYGYAQQADQAAANAPAAAEQTPSPAQPSPQPAEGQATAAKDANSGDQGQDTEQKPGALTRLKRHLRNQVSSGCVNAAGNHCWDKQAPEDQAPEEQKKQTETSAANSPPRVIQGTPGGESSSRGTKIDLSPPPGEAPAPGVGLDPAETEIREFKPWDPHKADKNVEVGDFYYKRGNYRAAVSRYEEALYWKDNDAIAMFRLGQTQEKLGQFSDARKNYAGYLKVLPEGEFAGEASKALERLKDKSDQPVAAMQP